VNEERLKLWKDGIGAGKILEEILDYYANRNKRETLILLDVAKQMIKCLPENPSQAKEQPPC